MKRKALSESSWRGVSSIYPWVRFRRREAGRMAESSAIHLDLRLFLLIASRVGASGHAVFEPDEMRASLVKVNHSTGEVSGYSKRHLDARLAAMTEVGVLAPSSNTRCAVVPMQLLDPQERERIYCPEHRHPFAWAGSGWVAISRNSDEVEAAA